MKWRAVALLFALSSCDGQTTKKTENIISARPSPSTKPIDGIGDLKLGMSFDEVLGKVDPSKMNPAGLRDCFDNAGIHGCFVSTLEGSLFEFREGIPYGAALSFNPDNKLTDISLSFERANISAMDCHRVFGKTIDWVANDYGPLRTPNEENDLRPFVTPRGTKYGLGKPSKDGSFSSGLLFSHDPVPGKLRKWGQRHLSLLMTYIVVDGEPQCDVHVDFHEPDTIARRSTEPERSPAVEEHSEGADVSREEEDQITANYTGD